MPDLRRVVRSFLAVTDSGELCRIEPDSVLDVIGPAPDGYVHVNLEGKPLRVHMADLKTRSEPLMRTAGQEP